MFGSKNKQTKSQAEISIETMEGNLKGEGGKASTVEYNQAMPAQTADSNKVPSIDNNLPPVVEQKSTVNNTSNSQEPFKSPFKGGDLPIGEPGSAEKNKIGQGSFPTATDNLTTEIPKKDDSAFLHQAIDGEIDNKNKLETKKIETTPAKKKGGINSFVLIVLFIALLAGIILGGYYFYMNKEGTNTKANPEVKETKQTSTPTQKTTNKSTTTTEKSIPKKATPVAPKIERLITSTATFNEDIAKFILDLKQRRNATDLQNGIFISPMATIENPLTSSGLLEALHMTAFFKQADLKDSCKLFALEDNGEIKIAVIFELTETADEKLIKDSIMQKEKDLMAKMSYLFVDGIKPVVPTEVNFAINTENMQARYKNYMPGLDTNSVDWNILDLGKGKIVYFATSRKTAKVLTDYFLRTVIK
jgi:hypothetical protein